MVTLFTPFNDSPPPASLIRPVVSASTIDTTEYNGLRQGVELTSIRHFSLSTQPKIWSGDIDSSGRIGHAISTRTYGQANSFTEYDGEIRWLDAGEFLPVDYMILGGTNSFPQANIVFNDGPQEALEAILQPFTIPGRTKSTETTWFVKQPHGELSDGNDLDSLERAASRVEQFHAYISPSVNRPFLEPGSHNSGITATYNGYWNSAQRVNLPFFDNKQKPVVDQTTSGAQSIIGTVLIDSEMNDDQDLRPNGTRSAAAGRTGVYGPNQSRYGTDSLAFAGMLRGS